MKESLNVIAARHGLLFDQYVRFNERARLFRVGEQHREENKLDPKDINEKIGNSLISVVSFFCGGATFNSIPPIGIIVCENPIEGLKECEKG